MKEYLHHFIVFAVHHIAMHKLQELSHLVFCNCLSYDCIIYQYSGKLKSEWILYQNVIIHCHLKGWSQHSPDGMNGTVAFPIFLLQFYKEQLCIGSFHTSYRLFAKCFLRKQSLYCNISLFRALPYSGLCFQISVYQFTDCHLSVHDIYKQIQICVYLFFQFTKGGAWLLALWKFVRRL